MQRYLFIAMAFVMICANSLDALAEESGEWGILKGQFLLEGEIPKLKPLLRIGGIDVPDERLVVDQESRGIANIVIYLQKKPDRVYPQENADPQKPVDLEIKDRRFIPHVLMVRTDQPIRILNNDAVQHIVHSYPAKNLQTNQLIKREYIQEPLKISEKLPATVHCDLSPWMRAYWMVLDHPYASISNKDGEFEIPNLPVGSHNFIVWHETAGYLSNKFQVEIKPGTNKEELIQFTAQEILKE